MTNKVKVLLTIVLVLVVAAVAVIVIQNGRFRVISSTVKGDILPTSSSKIVYTFNRALKPLREQDSNFLVLSSGVNYEPTIEDNTLIIRLSTILEENATLDLDIKSLISSDGDTFSDSFSFIVKYIPFNQLSTEEQEQQTNDSQLLNDGHPLLSRLPHDEITFRIESIIDESNFGRERDWRNEKENFIVTINTFALRSGVSQAAYKKRSLDIREQAKKWIQELGVDPNKDINILYSPSDAELDGQVISPGD